MSDASDANQAQAKNTETHPLDALTGGAFSAPTSGERAARVREWLAGNPAAEQIQEVFKELSVRDKGAARALRERLDELKRAKGQEAIAAEWAEKAQALLSAAKLNIADAMAWQRDAAKAGAPLSREPLAALKAQVSDRIRTIEDLQHRVQVQREAAVLLSQRIDVLSTKPWRDAQTAMETLRNDVAHWQQQAEGLTGDDSWMSVEARFPPLLDSSRAQLLVVWDAFQAAVASTEAAAADPSAALPPVPVWADEIAVARGGVPVALQSANAAADAPVQREPREPREAREPRAPRAPRAEADPALREKAEAVVSEALVKLEKETAEGHGKASVGAAAALRAVLKEHGRHVGDAIEAQVHAALTAAGELEGWSRWRSDQLREELVAKAESLTNRPEGQALGGRKMQETLRTVREQWKQTDQTGPANHALWKRFDHACNEAHKVVEAWLDKVKADAAEHRSQRLALIEELKAWGATQADGNDWKALQRGLHQFADRWRDAGHLSEKAFSEIMPQWKQAFAAAAEPLETAQKQSNERRQALIEEAVALGAAPMLRMDAVRSLQQRWQAEAQAVPMDRRHEQKLWDAFRKPLDEAFQRKGAEREKFQGAISDHDRVVLQASDALRAANDSGDVQQIHAAMNALEAAIKGQQAAAAAAAVPAAPAPQAAEAPAAPADGETSETPVDGGEAGEVAAPAPAPKPAPKPVVAVRRADDRPGGARPEPAGAARGGKFGSRDGGRPGGRDDRGPRPDRPGRFGDAPREDRGPRLGDAAFRAQRDAIESAQMALRKLAAQAHGEALTQLMTAWEQRDAAQLPGVQAFGNRVSPAARAAWAQALGAEPKAVAKEALLRLEMAAEVPTPADQLEARRMLQLQLLTRRNDPPPAQTWALDTTQVLSGAADAATARRLQNALKALLRG